MSDERAGAQISAGLGDFAAFKREMLRLLPLVKVNSSGSVTIPLARLDLRLESDPTVALIEAFAALADIVSFYQDRILNEGFLPTAVDYASLALLDRSLGENPGVSIGATAEVALFAQPGAPVKVPGGAALQANPPKTATAAVPAAPAAGAGTIVFETMTDAVANPALNQLTPLQTKPAGLIPGTESLLLQGTGLGLAVGDFMLLVRRGNPTQWVRLTVFSVMENAKLGTTAIGIGSSLQDQWTAAGCTETLPRSAAEGLDLYALDLTCRLFGYNAPFWSSQPASVKAANAPTGVAAAELTEWPGFRIDRENLDLQAVYPKVLPGNQFLLETPAENILGRVEEVSRRNVSEFGLKGQATHVKLDRDPAVLAAGGGLIPARTGLTASTLPDGRILLAGGIGAEGVLDSVEIYDPRTGLVTQGAKLPAGRALHSASTIGGVVYIAGGVTGAWELASDILQLDPATLTFSAIPGICLAIPRIEHAATVLPDGTLMLSGGLTGEAGGRYLSLEALRAATRATASVAVYSPPAEEWLEEAFLQRPRAGHSATLCPVLTRATLDAPAAGHIVVFLGGHDGPAMTPGIGGGPRGTIWGDGEVTDAVAWRPMPGLYPIETGSSAGSPRYAHAATSLTANRGFLVTGGESDAGQVSDNWLVGALADDSGAIVPVFVAAPPLEQARSNHAAALLDDDRICVAGGVAGATILDSVELFTVGGRASFASGRANVLAAGFVNDALPQPQAFAASAALPRGKLLICGGLGALPKAYLDAVVAYDPTIGTFATVPGPVLASPATLAPAGSVGLADGTILILGITAPEKFPGSSQSLAGFAWTYDPGTGLSSVAGPPIVPRIGASLSLLANGTVLVAGGMGVDGAPFGVLDTAEIYDPRSRSFRRLGSKMTAPRCGHSATLLADGSVLIVGGFFSPGIAYEPRRLLAEWVPALASGERFSAAEQAFTAVAADLPQGCAFHTGTLLASGEVLIAGGVTDFYTERDFGAAKLFPSPQAAVFSVSAQAFAPIQPLNTARAMHSATLLPSGKVLVAGGIVTPDMQATDATELLDPVHFTFSPSTPLAKARRSHGAIAVKEGLLLIGGASTPSYELFAHGIEARALPLPMAMPSPKWPLLVSLAAAVVPIPVAGRGVYAFGGQAGQDGANICAGIVYRDAAPTVDCGARRQALVYTQTRPLSLAPPIDDAPIAGASLELPGLVEGIAVGGTLLVAGNPPLAQAICDLSGIGGAPPVPTGTILMVLGRASPDFRSWHAEIPNVGELSIEAKPMGPLPAGLLFLSGNGSTIGNVTAAQLQLFARPLQSEAAVVEAVELRADSNTTRVTFAASLRYLYDRTTTAVYGNVVEVTQGSTVTETLGSGDGRTPFLSFLLKQAPLTWLEKPDGAIVPRLIVTVNDVAWQWVDTLGACDAQARAFQIVQDAQGRAQVQFGDGVSGMRVPTGQNNIRAVYRVGAGANGNVAAGALTRAPSSVGGIKAVLNPLAASGGMGAPPRSALRGKIPLGVADLGRIVTQDDMLSFVRNRPEVGAATLSSVWPNGGEAPPWNLVTLAAMGNAVPDMRSPAFQSLQAGVDFALASRHALRFRLLAVEPVPFKVKGWFTIAGHEDVQQVAGAIAALLQSTYAPRKMRFGQPVRAAEVASLIRKNLSGISAVGVTALWAPSAPSDAGGAGLIFPQPARLEPPRGAQILCLSSDTDAVQFAPLFGAVAGAATAVADPPALAAGSALSPEAGS